MTSSVNFICQGVYWKSWIFWSINSDLIWKLYIFILISCLVRSIGYVTRTQKTICQYWLNHEYVIAKCFPWYCYFSAMLLDSRKSYIFFKNPNILLETVVSCDITKKALTANEVLNCRYITFLVYSRLGNKQSFPVNVRHNYQEI